MDTTTSQNSCCATPGATPPTSGKPPDVEYLYRDLTTCERCQDTDSATKEALAVLSDVFATLGDQTR